MTGAHGPTGPPAHRLISTEVTLAEAIRDLKATPPAPDGARRFYLDTEFESNQKGTRLCLLQLSLGGAVYLFDTVSLGVGAALRPLLADRQATWVLHAGREDVRLLEAELGIAPAGRLLDTQIGWALLGAEAAVSLAYLKYRVCGLRTDKGHQTDDWLRRPMSASQLDYAALDVAQLPEIAQHLQARAESLQRLDLLFAASWDALRPEAEPKASLSLESFRNAWQLDRYGQAALLFLIEWYKALPSDEQQSAPEPKALLALAARRPKTPDELGQIKGVPRRVAERHGAVLLRGLAESKHRANSESFAELEPAPYATFEDYRLSAWLGSLRAEVCATLSVAPELALPSRVTARLHQAYQKAGVAGLTASLGGWRNQLLSAAIETFCERSPPPV